MLQITDIAARTSNGGNQLIVSSAPVPGGALYTSMVVNNGVVISVSSAFSPFAASSPQRFLNLSEGKSEAGVAITGTAAAGVMGISRTEGTSMFLVGEPTSASAKLDAVLFETNLPDTYVAGANIPVTVNAAVTGAGVLTAASTTITLKAFTEVNGVETALTVTAAQQMVPTGSSLAYTVTGTNLVPGQHIVFELEMTVTSASGANTGQVNSVSFQA